MTLAKDDENKIHLETSQKLFSSNNPEKIIPSFTHAKLHTYIMCFRRSKSS